MKVVLILANSADPDECSVMLHFIWVFTICQSAHLGVSSLQRVKVSFSLRKQNNLVYVSISVIFFSDKM